MIIYKLKESQFIFKFKGLSFYFSSQFYLNKFQNNVGEYVENEVLKFQNKYKVKIALEILFMIAYYKKVEKRGFRIVDEENQKEISENVGFGIYLLDY